MSSNVTSEPDSSGYPREGAQSQNSNMTKPSRGREQTTVTKGISKQGPDSQGATGKSRVQQGKHGLMTLRSSLIRSRSRQS
eukprot:1709300-Rhodomonas_salina.1